MNIQPVDNCIACDSDQLELCLDLGQQPLANNFREHETVSETRYPLAVNRCQHCDHLQLTHVVNPEIIYRNYLYVSGTSKTNLEYMDWYAKYVSEIYTDIPATVLDIGCNDGSQLDAFKRLGSSTYGVDPAENLHPVSSAKHRVVCGFWNTNTAQQLGTTFDIITSQNAFSHIPDPLSYLKLVREYLNESGLMFISTSQADMVLNGEFDTIYHEHISFYNAQSMQHLVERAGMYLVDVIKTPIHGVSYVFVISKMPFNHYKMKNILGMEEYQGLHNPSTYQNWAQRARDIMSETHQAIEQYRRDGFMIVGYGAAAKGMTLLSAADLNMDVIVDDNPLKQGRFAPGADIPIVSADFIKTIKEHQPVLYVPLAWNFYNEIHSRITQIRSNTSDKFLRYFPRVEVA
jgi:2-polyprenyl-3-methyl-5-hydroxy-6-metoxy-1,4-benzoquinol methylase